MKSLEVEAEVGSPGDVGAQIPSSHKMESQEMLSVFGRTKNKS